MTTEPSSDRLSENDEDTIEASFAVLELCLEQLSSIAPVDGPDAIMDLIPGVSKAAQRLILVELIKFDLAVSSEQGIERSLEFYWPAAGSILPHEDIPFDLLLEEVQLRRAAGESPKWADYRQRFPDLADTIGKWLAGGDTQPVSIGTGRVPDLPVGEQFDDFQVLKLLGQGAFARVYLARQVSMYRLVALKATSRGSEEPQALSQLDHANIVRVYDQREVGEPPTILLYMQYLPGGTLADCIKYVRDLPRDLWAGEKIIESIDRSLVEANQTPPEQSTIRAQVAGMEWAEMVAWMGIQLAQGLDYANTKGVLHRDIKPANILLSSEAIPKLADFNVSCSGLSGRAGAAACFGGSLAYMSPEQLQVADPTDTKEAEELDGRSDLYSLGIVLWELWQGRRPWALNGVAANWTEAVLMQKDLRHRPFEVHRPVQSAAERVLEKVLRSLLQVDPEQRPRSGTETAARLRLAFYPELATRFEPSEKSLAGRLLNLPVLLLSFILVFGPNIVASRFNYLYNFHRMGDKASAMVGNDIPGEDWWSVLGSAGSLGTATQKENGELAEKGVWDSVKWILIDEVAADEHPIERHFRLTSWAVNVIVYILGATLFWLVVRPFIHVVHQARRGEHASERDVHYLWTIGYRATLIAFILWAVSGIVFAVSMSTRFPDSFTLVEGVHFFLSLILCGGVAWIYPYYGMTLLSLLVYYPKVIAPSMSDPEFEKRSSSMRRLSSWYLLSALAIPITAIIASVVGELHAGWVLTGVVMTLVGVLCAYYAHQKIEHGINQFARVLGNQSKGLEV